MQINEIYYRQNVDDHVILEDDAGVLYRWYLGTERIEEAPKFEPRAGLIRYDPTLREGMAKGLRALGHTVKPTTSAAQRAAIKRYDAKNMAYQSVKIQKDLLKQFRAACAERGDKVNTVLRKAMEDYIAKEGRE